MRVRGRWKVRRESEPTGSVQALLALAYDIYSLQHTNRLPEHLLKRLKNRAGFQGARYEVAVAATFARMSWEITFLADKAAKHCEFIAKDPSGKLQVGVEAKSRHRAGVLHEKGELDVEKATRADVDRLFQEALAQAPSGTPFVVFVDLNSPPTPGSTLQEKPWWADLRTMMEAYGTPSPSAPDPYTALVLTSFPWHYVGDDGKAPGAEHVLAISRYPRHALPFEVFEHLRLALSEYGRVPVDDE